jgi:hypothetical protein
VSDIQPNWSAISRWQHRLDVRGQPRTLFPARELQFANEWLFAADADPMVQTSTMNNIIGACVYICKPDASSHDFTRKYNTHGSCCNTLQLRLGAVNWHIELQTDLFQNVAGRSGLDAITIKSRMDVLPSSTVYDQAYPSSHCISCVMFGDVDHVPCG